MKRTFFHSVSSRSASVALRSRSERCRPISGSALARCLGRGRLPRAQRAQGAVDHEVGIAADRAREVRVHVGGQAEVAEVLLVVARQLHGAQQQVRDELLLGLALDLAQDELEVLRPDVLEVGGHAVAERRHQVAELLDPLGVGLLVDAVERAACRRCDSFSATASLAASMNSSITRMLSRRAVATMPVISPAASSTSFGSGRSKSSEPRS